MAPNVASTVLSGLNAFAKSVKSFCVALTRFLPLVWSAAWPVEPPALGPPGPVLPSTSTSSFSVSKNLTAWSLPPLVSFPVGRSSSIFCLRLVPFFLCRCQVHSKRCRHAHKLRIAFGFLFGAVGVFFYLFALPLGLRVFNWFRRSVPVPCSVIKIVNLPVR